MAIHCRRDAFGIEHLLLITVDREHERNALDAAHLRQLEQTWHLLATDDHLRVAIITGVGRCFISGSAEPQAARLPGEDLWKPVIAAINGPCLDAGMEVLGRVDLRVASEHARFGILEPSRGRSAGGGTAVLLPRQISYPAAMELLLCADTIDADQALTLGLLNHVVAEQDLMDTAESFARRILANAPLSVQATKRSVLEGLTMDQEDAYANEATIADAIHLTADAKEGPRAFSEKRPPVWTGT